MTQRDVSYELEEVDELPEASGGPGSGASSPLEDGLRAILMQPHRHAPKWNRIGRYSNAAAAASARKALQRKHGFEPDVEGWRFEVRPVTVDGTEYRGLFAQYDHSDILPGKKEVNDKEFAAYKHRMKEAADRRIEQKAKAGVEFAAKIKEQQTAKAHVTR